MVDFLIVGCGLAGLTASRVLADKGYQVLVIDKRNHIGGNIYDYYNQEGILIHKYGPHIFHTHNRDAWNFLSHFTEWNGYVHKVLTYVNGLYVPMPINLDTINLIYHVEYDAETMKAFLNRVKTDVKEIRNSKDVVVSQVGEELYLLLFEGYTKKQWGRYPYELDKKVTSRIPIRFNHDNRYFTDKFQGIPKGGYTEMAWNMLHHKNISVMLNTEYKEIQNKIKCGRTIFTGCVDELFKGKYGKLPYRSLNFIEETYNKQFYQTTGVVNFPNNFEYTRITEYKYLTGQKSEKTTIVKEIPCSCGEPYYPIPQKKNRELYYKYKREASAKNIDLLGRLGTYQYLNMDEVILQALHFCRDF